MITMSAQAALCQPARFPQDLVMRHPLRPAPAGPARAPRSPARCRAAARNDHRRPFHARLLQPGHAGGDVLGAGLLCRLAALPLAAPAPRRPPGRQIGLVAAAAALWLWMAELGFAAGLVAMLCTWMLAAMLLPALAAWHRPGTESP
jgi:hypothetical protein